MKKNGFTLAEILVALAIVGVVAAISIPGLVTESRKKVLANSLSAAISNFENAMTSYLIYENKASLTETKAWTEDIDLADDKALGKRFRIEKKSSTAENYYTNAPKSLNPKSTLPALSRADILGQAYEAHNGVVYFVNKDPKESGPAAKIGIDVNGKKVPNRIGRDIFVFFLDQDGYMIPYGKGDFGEPTLTEENCSTSVIGMVGEHCAARLVKNGFKMDY